MSERRTHERGQVFPLWAFGLLGTLSIGVALLQYGELLTWQIRAQNAADSAATAMASVQAQHIDRMMLLQTNLGLEEVRIRHLADGAFFAARQTGYCSQFSGGCEQTFDTLVGKYNQAVNRYSNLVLLYNDATAKSTFPAWKSDATNLLSDLTTAPLCGTASGLDCAFFYTVPPDGAGGIGGLAQVDPGQVTFQIQNGYGSFYIGGGKQAPQPNLTNNPFYPVRTQVTVCRKVSPIVANFFGIKPAPWSVIATSAAESFPVNEEWWKPGLMTDTASGQLVQAPEQFAGPDPSDPSDANAGVDDMYNPVFQGKINYMPGSGSRKQFEFQYSWWSAFPIHPFLIFNTDYTAKC